MIKTSKSLYSPLSSIVAFIMVLLFMSGTSTFGRTKEILEYHINKKDYIVKVLEALDVQPVYGEEGSLQETIRLNPFLKERDNYAVFPGDTLLIPVYMSQSYTVQKSHYQIRKNPPKKQHSNTDEYFAFKAPSLHLGEFNYGWIYKKSDIVSQTGVNILLNSNLNHGVGISYTMAWESKKTLSFHLNSFTYSVANTESLQINQAESSILYFSADYLYPINEKFSFLFGARFNQELLIREDGSDYSLDRKLVPSYLGGLNSDHKLSPTLSLNNKVFFGTGLGNVLGIRSSLRNKFAERMWIGFSFQYENGNYEYDQFKESFSSYNALFKAEIEL